MPKDGVKESEGRDYKTTEISIPYMKQVMEDINFHSLEKESISKMIWSWNFRAEAVNSFCQFILFLLL